MSINILALFLQDMMVVLVPGDLQAGADAGILKGRNAGGGWGQLRSPVIRCGVHFGSI